MCRGILPGATRIDIEADFGVGVIGMAEPARILRRRRCVALPRSVTASAASSRLSRALTSTKTSARRRRATMSISPTGVFQRRADDAIGLGDEQHGGAALRRKAEPECRDALRARRAIWQRPSGSALRAMIWLLSPAPARADRARGAAGRWRRRLRRPHPSARRGPAPARNKVSVVAGAHCHRRRRRPDDQDDLAARFAVRAVLRQRLRDRRGGVPRAAWSVRGSSAASRADQGRRRDR